ncbi:DISARM system helicase DrmA [Salinactinospora qingdaonensis]|uniref:DISARM system helicase DrmA n=1 Tax=Salinactinospora qingdaonensis TaxID=702744 RepID=A0ABP7EYP8_9ACTN
MKVPSAREIRAELEELVVADLYGPIGGDEHEEFSGERPTDRYILGRLAPNGAVFHPEEQDNLAEVGLNSGDEVALDPDDDDPEPEAPATPSMSCSAHGFTASVAPDTERLLVRATWARYVDATADDGSGKQVRRRDPRSGQTLISLAEGEIPAVELDPEQPGVCLRGRVRSFAGHTLVTLFLVNGQTGEDREWKKWLFQAELRATAADGAAPVFVPRPDHSSGGDQLDREEQRRLAMTYRFAGEFAVGHSTAVAVDPAPDDPMRAVAVRTASVPRYELPHTDVPSAEEDPDLPELARLTLDMSELARMQAGDVRAGLDPLVTGYRAWIARQRDRITDPAAHLAEYRAEAEKNLADAERAAHRIEAAVELLATDPAALRAFQFANEAMRRQRVHSLAAAARGGDTTRAIDEVAAELDTPRNRSWRPFQLAFLLLNLPSLTDPAHEERAAPESRVADLLWFPTGGGKTEAYLGLTAYTLAIRRLQGDLDGADVRGRSGVAVLMRYTLRLLTIQQFQRAAALICACEVLRRDDEDTWGRVPFRIGLWVGGRVTPNRTKAAEEWVRARRSQRGGAGNRADGSPHQLVTCPWCGATVDSGSDIDVDPAEQRTRIRCPDLECPFSAYPSGGEGLPVLVVDDEIYRLVPSLIIATVDKFAQLAWQGETQALFGRVGRVCTRHGYLAGELHQQVCGGVSQHQAETRPRSLPAAHVKPTAALRPPDLIVQDELHLISGPLGSLVGLYETAVDRLASWDYTAPGSGATVQVRPKVIASTATVRRATRQIGALFAGRDTRVFPPQGLDAADNFFSRQRAPERRDGRRYIGLCAHGVRIKSVQIRVFVAILAAAQRLHDTYGGNEVTDPYMTLVGYFNSLRDLGGMRRLVDDDVATRLGRADQRGLARRRTPWAAELTSRLGSDDIPAVLERLAVSAADRTKRPIDVLLATNMIAVGVDVARLGVMTVNNQPKSTAEYIQATSRVGRRAPGLVFTVYNWSRPRDLSHYERFHAFHATMYRHVEALSVTPFAARAVDRGLMGVLVSLVRNLETALNPNDAARMFDRSGKVADHIVNEIDRRARTVTGSSQAARDIHDELDNRLDVWEARRRKQGVRLVYKEPPKNTDAQALLDSPDGAPWKPTTCPTSLREVEPGIRLVLDPGQDLGDGAEPPFIPYTSSETDDRGEQ